MSTFIWHYSINNNINLKKLKKPFTISKMSSDILFYQTFKTPKIFNLQSYKIIFNPLLLRTLRVDLLLSLYTSNLCSKIYSNLSPLVFSLLH